MSLEDGQGGSLENLVDAFTQRMTELHEQMLLRGCEPFHQQDLRELQTRLNAIEKDMRKIREWTKNERQSITRFRASLVPMQMERDFLNHMLQNLPERMPKPNTTQQYHNSTMQLQQQHVQQQQHSFSNQISNNYNSSFSYQQNQDLMKQNMLMQNNTNFGSSSNNISQLQYDSSQQESEIENEQQQNYQRNIEKAQKQPPKNYVTVAEFKEVPQYMRGRLITRDKVNAALDDFVDFSKQNSKLMQQVKQNSVKLSQSERNRATELYYNVASKHKRKFWFCEGDLRGGKTIKYDNTGKSILTILRHLGRLQEVRVSILGQQTIVYLLE